MPSDFEWDNMKEGIYNKMDKEPKKRPFLLLFVGIFSLALMYGGFKLLETKNLAIENDQKRENQQVKHTEYLNSQVFEIKEEVNSISTKEIVSSSSAGIASTEGIGEDKKPSASDVTKVKGAIQNHTSQTNKISPSNSPMRSVGLISDQYSNYVEYSKSDLTLTLGQERNTKSLIESATEQKEKQLLGLILPLPSKNLSKKVNRELTELPVLDLESKTIDIAKPASALTIGLYGGAALVSLDGSNAVNSPYTNLFPGFHAGLVASYSLNDRWSLYSSVSRYELKEKFRYEGWRTYQELRESVLVDQVVSTITRTIIHENHRDTSITIQEYNNILEYNNYSLSQINLGFQYSLLSGRKLRLAVSMGVSYGVLSVAEGKRLNPDLSVLSFESKKDVFKSTSIALELGVKPSWELTDRTALFLNVGLNKSLTNWSLLDEAVKPIIYRAGIGIARKF